ncbi:MAG: hypothetical protein O2943_00885 [Actinomycetota bacterium]|nr:hypothetical protein [Actinomycetota bacterium]
MLNPRGGTAVTTGGARGLDEGYDNWRRGQEINVNGPFLWINTVAPAMVPEAVT